MLTALSKLTISPSLFLSGSRLFNYRSLFFLEVVLPHFKLLNHSIEQLSIHILFLLQHALMIFYLLLKSVKICLELRIFVLQVSRSPFDQFPNDILRLNDHQNHLWLHFCCSFCSFNRKNIRYPREYCSIMKERSELSGKFVYFPLYRCLVEGLGRYELGKSSDYLGGFFGIVEAHIYINIDFTLPMMQVLFVFACLNVPSRPQVPPNRGRSHQQSRIQFLIFLFNFFYSDGAGEGRVGFEIFTERTRRQTIAGV